MSNQLIMCIVWHMDVIFSQEIKKKKCFTVSIDVRDQGQCVYAFKWVKTNQTKPN